MSNEETNGTEEQETINPWDVPEGEMVPTLTCMCPRCRATLGVPIKIAPLGVSNEGKIIAIETEEDAQSIKGVIFTMASPMQTFRCPRCTGQGAPKPEGGRIITL